MHNSTSVKQLIQSKVAQAQQEPTQPLGSTMVKKAVNNNLSVFSDVDSFAAAQRMAHALASADFTPDTFRGKIANCLLALEMANRINSSVVAVMQNLYIVKGKPAWSGKYVIAAINASGRFQTSLMYNMEYDPVTGGPIACTAYAHDKLGNKLEGPKITMKMANGEGWLSNSKWTNMPDLMFRYRSASFFGNTYVPDILMGMQTVEEIEDMEYARIATPDIHPQEETSLEQALSTLNETTMTPDTKPQAHVEETIDAIIEEVHPVTKTHDPIAETKAPENAEVKTPESVVEVIEESIHVVEEPKQQLESVLEAIEFEIPTNMEELEFLMIDLGLEMDIKQNAKKASFAKAIGEITPAKADVLIKIGFKQKGEIFVCDVTEFVLKDEADSLF